MEGHIRRRGKGKGNWEIAIDIGKDPSTGRRRQHFETVRGGKAVAQKRLHELLLSVEQDNYIKPNRLTVA